MVGVIDAEVEKREIINRYRRLLRKSKHVLKEGDARVIKKAFTIAAEGHKDMRRKSGDPFIFHPLAVAEICVEEIGLGTTAIIAALLHDVVEDTTITLENIEEMFGKKVARIVDGLTKIRGVFEYGSSAQAENYRKMLVTLSDDVRVILIKLADRLHNMRTLDCMPRNKQLRIASETIYLFAPLAHRLGLNAIKTELEDLYLRFTDYEVFKMISDKIEASRIARNRFIKHFVQPLKEELEILKINCEIKGRPKSVYSIMQKMRKQNIPFEEVYDLFAVRIIIDAPLDQEKSYCWQVYSIVTDFYTPNPDRLRDWISTPRANGYESLHTTVMAQNSQWVEVQIRTRRMDEIAEKGYAAHWKYKDGTTGESNLEKWLVQVGDVLKQKDLSALEFVDEFRGDLYIEEVFVFTPKGELRTLPKGATVLDFAFEIHTDVGGKCIGAKVNQKLMPINHELSNGDQIEILTSSKQKANDDWLRFVKSAKAKAKIKDLLKDDRKALADQGKEILMRKLRQLKIDATLERFEQMRNYFKVPSQFELYYNVAKEVITLDDLKRFKLFKPVAAVKNRPADLPEMNAISQTIKAKGRDEDTLLIGEDMDVVDYKLAKCCVPIQGDEVFGFVTINEGIKIHRISCPNATELMANHSNRIIKAKWAGQHQLSFLTGLRVTGNDRLGLINDIAKIISEELKVNMTSLTFRSEKGVFKGEIMLYINNAAHLEDLMHKIEQIPGVQSTTRFEKDSVEKLQ